VGGIPPGFARIPRERLRALNVPAADRKSVSKRTGSPTSIDAPVQNEQLPRADVAPAPQSGFMPGNGSEGGASAGAISPLAATAPGEALTGTSATEARTALAASAAPNAIVLENQKPGSPRSEWDLAGAATGNIEGFTTNISYNVGQRVDFKIDTSSTNYRVDIYRLGYYGGAGARKVATLQHQGAAPVQPDALVEASTGMVDAGNWSVTDSWTMPADAVSGVYVAKLVRQDGTFGEAHVPFIVRNEASTSDIVFQTSDLTWQAYNGWGGANVYGGNGPGGGTAPGPRLRGQLQPADRDARWHRLRLRAAGLHLRRGVSGAALDGAERLRRLLHLGRRCLAQRRAAAEPPHLHLGRP
jgi:hypothetical protein